MKKSEVREMIEKSIIGCNQIQIKRSKIDVNSIEGIPLIISEDLILVQYLYDFQLDGFKILRMKDITNVRYDEIERFSEDIFRKEGIFNQNSEAPLPNLNNWKSVFEELMAIGNNIILECENMEESDFYIGRVRKINKDSLLFLGFDAVGEWDKEPTHISFKDITSVGIDSRYIAIISKYTKEYPLD